MSPLSHASAQPLVPAISPLTQALSPLAEPMVRVAAGLLLVAAFGVHLGNGFFWTAGGFEYPLLWGIVTLAFVLRGGGRFSLDALIGREI
jgi:putative oxidoreductase